MKWFHCRFLHFLWVSDIGRIEGETGWRKDLFGACVALIDEFGCVLGFGEGGVEFGSSELEEWCEGWDAACYYAEADFDYRPEGWSQNGI